MGALFIHDFRTTDTLGAGANDINPRSCTRVRAAIRWSDSQVLEFRPWGFMTLVTRRLEDENTLIWEYPGQSTSRLRRVCRLPGSEVWTSRSGGENTHLPRGISTGDPAHA